MRRLRFALFIVTLLVLPHFVDQKNNKQKEKDKKEDGKKKKPDKWEWYTYPEPDDYYSYGRIWELC